MNTIFIATKNKGKVKDFEKLFSNYGITVRSLLDDTEIPEVEETGSTFEENAALKAETISNALHIPVLADDSGLEVDALNGKPGIFSARYAGENKDDQANMEKVLNQLEDIPIEKRTSRFVCVLALARPGEQTIFKKGYCEGTITYQKKGENGFGYDPIFKPKGYEKTMAELSPQEKNKVSHRQEALLQLESWLNKL